ncbi:MAG: radical SAM family heme chaperone HemW [Alphaproteobacteria bacterium]
MTADRDTPLGLYVHWPFCKRKCPYCDFNSHVRDTIDHARWAQALITGLDYWVERMDNPRALASVFFGGGTPSLMAPETVAAILARAEKRLGFTPNIEITLEANPTSVEAARFNGVRAAGVNRVSLGVQALNNDDLAFLGREHSVDEALAALTLAQSTFKRVSFDLIYARHNQTPQNWADELSRALGFGTDHLSLYQLTIEPETEFGKRFAKGQLPVLPDDDQADLYEITQSLTKTAGLPAYEISNHARMGEESRHNMIYWQGGDWIGLGPGAHGRVKMGGHRLATREARTPENWLRLVERQGMGAEAEDALPRQDDLTERLMMGLRLTQGIDGAPFASILDQSKIADLTRDGFIDPASNALRLTDKGRPLLNAILVQIIKD